MGQGVFPLSAQSVGTAANDVGSTTSSSGPGQRRAADRRAGDRPPGFSTDLRTDLRSTKSFCSKEFLQENLEESYRK